MDQAGRLEDLSTSVGLPGAWRIPKRLLAVPSETRIWARGECAHQVPISETQSMGRDTIARPI